MAVEGPGCYRISPTRRVNHELHFGFELARHYYDVYCLLELPEVLAFIGTPAYEARKAQRFRTGDERVIARNPAFLLENPAELARFEAEYRKTAALYYDGQPGFDAVLARIRQHVSVM